MEPERKIEKLLRNYAKKRRAEAGDSFKLHPATRRLLQGEVSRRSPAPEGRKPGFFGRVFGALQPEFIYGAAFAVFVFMGALMVLPALSKAKSRSQMASSMSNLKQVGAAAQIFAADNKGRLPVSLTDLEKVANSNVLTDPASGLPFVYVGGGREIASLKTDSVLAYSPAESKTHAVLFADGRVEALNAVKFSELTNRGLLLLAANEGGEMPKPSTPVVAPMVAANEPTPIRVPDGSELDQARRKAAFDAEASKVQTLNGMTALASKTPALSASTVSPGTVAEVSGALASRNVAMSDQATPLSNASTADAPASGQFVSDRLASQNLFKNSLEPATTAPVLSNFEVRQEGETLNFVDADGSVYKGKLQAGQLGVPSGAAIDKMERSRITTKRDDVAKDLRAEQNRGQSPAAQNYFFRVSGTNRSLGQNVVFTGNWSTLSNTAQNAGQLADGIRGGSGGGNLAPPVLNQSQQFLLQNSRIAGTAVIGGTNRIQIDALPATQLMNSPQRTQ